MEIEKSREDGDESEMRWEREGTGREMVRMATVGGRSAKGDTNGTIGGQIGVKRQHW
jgi:hypothetical protein